MKTILPVLGFSSLLLTTNALAISDPVSWTLSPANGFPQVGVGGHAAVTYTFNNHLPFPVFLRTETHTTGGVFNLEDACNRTSLEVGGSCQVKVDFAPKAAGKATFQMILGYHNNRIPLPVLTATANEQSTQQGLKGSVILALPENTYKYADHLVRFQFENNDQTAVTLGQVNIQTNGLRSEARITKPAMYDHCSGKTLSANGGKCTVMASVIPATVRNNLTVTATATAGAQTTQAQTSTSVHTNLTTDHHVMFVNQCNFDVWYGIANGGTASDHPDPNLSQHPAGAPPATYRLAAQASGARPSVIDISINQYSNGAIWPRTGCSMTAGQFVCATGTCATMDHSATCVDTGALQQPIAPYTKFEFDIKPGAGNDGVYDVSVINGFTVPVEIKAFGPETSDPFNCSGAGALIQPQGSTLAACPWQFNPGTNISSLPVNDFLWVNPGENQTDCTPGTSGADGMGFNAPYPHNGRVCPRKGHFLGYSTLANYYGYPADGQWQDEEHNLYKKYSIDAELPTVYGTIGGEPANWSVLFACTPTSNGSADSCYNTLDPTVEENCCGCVNWQEAGSPVHTASSQACNYKNPHWTSITPTGGPSGFTIEKGILWLKQACPTAYSYQFDDKSSSFQCTQDSGTPLTTSYQITFCPGGVSGLPAGVPEGRSTPLPSS